MKIAALIIGIFGGLIALSYGLVGYGLGSLGPPNDPMAQQMKAISLGLPVLALVGAGLVMAKPLIGALMMGAAALAFIFILGFNFFSLVPVTLLGTAALLGFFSIGEVDAKVAGR